MSDFMIITISGVFGVMRLAGFRGNIFKDAAHFWIGGLIGAWWMAGGSVMMWSVIVLSIVETFCAFVFFARFHPFRAIDD